MVADGPLVESQSVDLAHEFDIMVNQGVESVRAVFNWRVAQPYRYPNQVPPQKQARFTHVEHGVPTDYTATDRVVAETAKRHLTLLPVVMLTPAWAAADPDVWASRPSYSGFYADYVHGLAERYGPSGTFWIEHPELPKRPLRYWQFWNEPSLGFYFYARPWQPAYVDLLRAAHDAVKSVDPGARVVLAGLPNRSWPALRSLYRRGARKLFDLVAAHPFTHAVKGVGTILGNLRRVMRKNGDAKKPLWVTELSWTTAGKRTEWKYGNETTEAGQAKKLTGAMALLAKNRRKLRLGRVYWYTWMTDDHDQQYPFDYAGLSRRNPDGSIVRKPAFDAYRRAVLPLEGCTTKAGLADHCAG
jgi:hypothetical protein